MKGKWPKAAQKWKEALGKYQYVILVMAVGAALLLLPAGGRDSPRTEEPAREEGVTFDLEAFERKLERTLSQVEGAGETQVVLTLDGGSRQVLARNQDREGDGGTSKTVVRWGRAQDSRILSPFRRLPPSFGARWWCAPEEAAPRCV